MSTNHILSLVSTLETWRGAYLAEFKENSDKMFPDELSSERLDGVIDAYSIVLNELLRLRFTDRTDYEIITDTIDFTYNGQKSVGKNNTSGENLSLGYAHVREHLFEARNALPVTL